MKAEAKPHIESDESCTLQAWAGAPLNSAAERFLRAAYSGSRNAERICKS